MQNIGRSILSYLKRADKLLWLIMLTISIYSLLLLRTVPKDDGKSYFLIHLLAIGAGYAGALFITFFDYRNLAKLWWLVGGFCLLLLVYTQINGLAIESSGGMNTRAWIEIPGGLTFQPSELVKIAFMLTFGKHLSILQEKDLLKNPLQIVLLGVHALIPVGWMVIIQKDMGSAVVFFFMFLVMSFGAGIQLRYFAVIFALMAVAIPYAWNSGIIANYQKDRLTTFLHPEEDPIGNGLQQLQGRISIGSGQLWGRGLGDAPRVQKGAVPVQESDYIFSVAGESLGIVGCILILLLLLLLMYRVLRIAHKSTDLLGSSICLGFFAIICIQTISNIGMCLLFLPVMGVTLPFFSAGGSSSACLYLGFGLVECVAMHRNDPEHVTLHSRVSPAF